MSDAGADLFGKIDHLVPGSNLAARPVAGKSHFVGD
jgi:hypothetical protein